MEFESTIRSIVEKVFETQITNIQKAVKLGLESKRKNHKFYVFGTGHSHMVAEELYDRLAGLDLFDSILMPELMLHQFPGKSTMIERLDSYADVVLNMYPINKGDTILLVSNSGRNGLLVEIALRAYHIGANVITLTNFQQAKIVKSRHHSNKSIVDFSHINIDNCGEYGDACMTTLSGYKVAPTSTITTMLIAQLMNAIAYHNLSNSNESIEDLVARFKQYYFTSFDRVKIEDTKQIAQLLYNTEKSDHDIFFIGMGHSHMLCEEAYTRAGGFAHFRIILEDEMMNHQGKQKSTLMDSLLAYKDVIIKKYDIKEKDTVIFFSNSQSGAFTNEFALELKNRNVNTVAFVNTRQNSLSKHPLNIKLEDTVDYIVDNGCDNQDANFKIEDKIMCPLSSSITSYVLQGLFVNLTEIYEKHNEIPPVLVSANVDMDHTSYKTLENHNDKIKLKYKSKYHIQHKL